MFRIGTYRVREAAENPAGRLLVRVRTQLRLIGISGEDSQRLGLLGISKFFGEQLRELLGSPLDDLLSSATSSLLLTISPFDFRARRRVARMEMAKHVRKGFHNVSCAVSNETNLADENHEKLLLAHGCLDKVGGRWRGRACGREVNEITGVFLVYNIYIYLSFNCILKYNRNN